MIDLLPILTETLKTRFIKASSVKYRQVRFVNSYEKMYEISNNTF